VRDWERSSLLSDIGDLQGSLGEFDAAAETAGVISEEGERQKAQGRICYWMARRGRATKALERARALDAPEPRLGALVQVAQACDGIMTDRKSKKEK
jgi:hypothetical protein